MSASNAIQVRFESNRFLEGFQRTIVYIVLTIASIAFLFPLLWMLSTSLKVQEQIMAMPPQLIPNPFDWVNYVEAVTAPGFDVPMLLKNTLTYAVLETIGVVISCTLVAYSFARMQWPAGISSSSRRWRV